MPTRFLRELFVNEPRDLNHVRSLIGDATREFEGAKIIGDFNRPASVELYRSEKPAYDEHPFATYTRDESDELVDPEYSPAPKAAKTIIRRRRK